MSEYYKPIDFSKYSYSVPDSLKEFADRELTEKELKELDLIPSGGKDIARATLGVGKALLNISDDKDKDKKDKGAEKEKKLDFEQYAEFLEKGFKNYADQYFVHPIIYYNEKERQVGYTVLSMVTDSTITLQPYKLADNDLYKISIQKLPGKITNIVQKVFGFPYSEKKRIKYERMTVSNISTSKDPVRDFKMDQIIKAPIYKELNKYNPKKGEKYSCSLIFYDESKSKLVMGQDIAILQVTQDIVTLGKIFVKKDAKGNPIKDDKGKEKKFLKTHEISLSMLIPAYAVVPDESKKKMEKSNPFYYKHIFPITTSSSQEYEKFSEASKKELVLFYVRPFLVVKESEKDMDSFNADMSTFNFDNYKGYVSGLSSLIYGEPDKSSPTGTPKLPKIPLSKLKKFMTKHGSKIRLYGWTPKLRAILLRYARLTPGYSVYDLNNKHILREEEVQYSVDKERLNTLTTENKLPILDLQYIDEEASSDPNNPYLVFKILKKGGDTSYIQTRQIDDRIKIPSNYFEHIESIKIQNDNEMGLAFIDNTYFEETSDSSPQSDEIEEETPQEESSPVSPDFQSNRNNPPANSSTTTDSVDEIISNTTEIQTNAEPEQIVNEIDAVINEIDNEADSQEQSVNDSRESKILNLVRDILIMVTNNSDIDIIELDSSEINNPSEFSNKILDLQSIDELSDLVVKKYNGKLKQFNSNSDNDYFVIDNVNEVELPPTTQASETSGNSETPQSNDIPDINNRDGDITYYSSVEEKDLKNSASVELSDKRSFYEGWGKDNKYYIRINPKNNEHKSVIERSDTYLDGLFDYNNNLSATLIKNIEPAVFNISSGQLIEKGRVELS